MNRSFTTKSTKKHEGSNDGTQPPENGHGAAARGWGIAAGLFIGIPLFVDLVLPGFVFGYYLNSYVFNSARGTGTFPEPVMTAFMFMPGKLGHAFPALGRFYNWELHFLLPGTHVNF